MMNGTLIGLMTVLANALTNDIKPLLTVLLLLTTDTVVVVTVALVFRWVP